MSQQKYVSEGQKLLLEWMERSNLSIRGLSTKMDIHYHVCWTWVSGKGRPELAMACRIEDLTNGEVSCRSWFRDIKPKKSTKPGKTKNDKVSINKHKDG